MAGGFSAFTQALPLALSASVSSIVVAAKVSRAPWTVSHARPYLWLRCGLLGPQKGCCVLWVKVERGEHPRSIAGFLLP